MPVDEMMVNPMLDPFRKMLTEVEEKGLSGEDYDNMKATLNRMEELSQIHSDIMAYNGALMQENLFAKFSDYYSKVLSAEAKQNSDSNGYDDATLLKQTVDALKNAVKEIKRNYQASIEESNKHNHLTTDKENDKDKNPEKQIDQSVEVSILTDPTLIIKGIEDVIALGEQEGMTLPKFLRLQIETGLDKAMEGSVVLKKGLEYTLNATKANAIGPINITIESEKLEAFNTLANKSKFNVPNSKELSYLHKEIDYKYRHQLAEWTEIKNRWYNIIDDLSLWSLAYTKVAPYILPWRSASDPVEATIFTQKTAPGILKEKLKLFDKYFGISFFDIFKHPSFKWEVENHHFYYSQEFIEFLIEDIFPECEPFNDLPQDKINKRLAFYEEGREANPEQHKALHKVRDFYDSYFGQGRFEEKFYKIEQSQSNAKPWNLSAFKYIN